MHGAGLYKHIYSLFTLHTMPAVLDVDRVCFGFSQRHLFTHWSARIGPGVTLLLGGDGSGKTSLLRLIAGELVAASGRFRIHDTCLADDPRGYRAKLFWIDARTTEHDQISGRQFLQSRPGIRMEGSAWDAMVRGLSLEASLDKPMFMLSTGSKRKVWLAAAFASSAPLTLLDQPLAALDRPSIGYVRARLAAAAMDTNRAWVVADCETPSDVPLSATFLLD